MTLNSASFCCGILLLSASFASAEDFKLSDGTLFRGVHVMEVRPDAVIFSHDRGIAMADLATLSKSLRARYGFDPAKAAAYREREALAAQAVAAEKLQLLAAQEQRKMELIHAEAQATQVEATGVPSGSDVQLSYQAGASDRAYAAALAEVGTQIARADEARIAALAPKTFWTADFWQLPALRLLGGLLGGLGSNPDSRSNSEPANWR